MKHLKRFLKRKYIVWAIVAVAVVGLGVIFIGNNKSPEAPFVVRSGEFLNQISVSGKIEASENVDLSFEQTGIVRAVYVKVGDKVDAGKLIASQDTAQLYAQSLQMQAGIDLQKAKLNQLLAGSSSEDIKIKEDAVLAAKQNLQNTNKITLSHITDTYKAMYDAYIAVTYIEDVYFTIQYDEGRRVRKAKEDILGALEDAKKSSDAAKTGAETVNVVAQEIIDQLNIIYSNLEFIRKMTDDSIFNTPGPNDDKTSLDTQKENIQGVLDDMLSLNQEITFDEAALQKAENELEAIKAAPRITDTAIYNAQIKQAQASLQEIYAQIREKQIIAPIFGTISVINAKVGSIMGSTGIAASIISSGAFKIESYVPEIYISSVVIGNDAQVTLDAYGAEKKFDAKVVFIDPSQTQKDGVATYKTTLQFVDDDQGFKDGMSANVLIITNKKENVISVPQGLVKIKDGKKIVNVKQGSKIIEKEVQTGDVSSSGQVEITAGLVEGEIVVE